DLAARPAISHQTPLPACYPVPLLSQRIFPMSFRVLGFILAILLFVGYRVIKPRAQASDKPECWNLSMLFLASALTLFAELALIRWVATEVRVFAYVKN